MRKNTYLTLLAITLLSSYTLQAKLAEVDMIGKRVENHQRQVEQARNLNRKLAMLDHEITELEEKIADHAFLLETIKDKKKKKQKSKVKLPSEPKVAKDLDQMRTKLADLKEKRSGQMQVARMLNTAVVKNANDLAKEIQKMAKKLLIAVKLDTAK